MNIMYKDKIVEEVRKTREKIFAEFDYDIHKLSEYIYKKQEKNKDKYKYVSTPFKKSEKSK